MSSYLIYFFDLTLLISIHNTFPGTRYDQFCDSCVTPSLPPCTTVCSHVVNCLASVQMPHLRLSEELRAVESHLGVCRMLSQRLEEMRGPAGNVSVAGRQPEVNGKFAVVLRNATEQLPGNLIRIRAAATVLTGLTHGAKINDLMVTLQAVVAEMWEKNEQVRAREKELIEERAILAIQQSSNAENKSAEALEKVKELMEKKWRKLDNREQDLRERSRRSYQKEGELNMREEVLEKREKQVEAKSLNNSVLMEMLETKQEQLKAERSKLEQEQERFQKERDKVNLLLRLLFLIVIVFILYKALSLSKGRTIGVARQSRRPIANNPPQVLDLCHLSLTRERNYFFEHELLPRLADSNVRPRSESRILTRPSDFDNIPPALCYIVHWTSQRMSIFSNSWSHQGLLRALDQSPVMILVYDSERLETLPDGECFDRSFRQIETEYELVDAAKEHRLITYRANERFNEAQTLTLRNWVNANITEPL